MMSDKADKFSKDALTEARNKISKLGNDYCQTVFKSVPAIRERIAKSINNKNIRMYTSDAKDFFSVSFDKGVPVWTATERQTIDSAVVYYGFSKYATGDKWIGKLREAVECFGFGDGNKCLEWIESSFQDAGIDLSGKEIKKSKDPNALDWDSVISDDRSPKNTVKKEQEIEAEQAETLKKVNAHAKREVKTVKETFNSGNSKKQDKTTSEEDHTEDSKEYHIFEPLTLDDILETPALDFLTDNLIVRNTINVFFAPAKTGKTYACLSYAISLVMNIPFVGMENHLNRNVGYLNLDMFRGGFNDRVKQVIKGFNPNATREYINGILDRLKIIDRESIRSAGGHIPNFFKEEFLDDLRNFIIANDIEFLFIDTFSRIRGGSAENDNDDMAVTLQNMESFFTPLNCGCIIIHHTGKDGKLRGASAIIDNAEFVFGLRKVNGSNKHLQLFSDTPRYTDVFELDVYPVFDQCTNEETGASHADSYFLSTVESNKDSSAVISFLKSTGNAYISKRNIASHAEGNYAALSKEVDSLFAQGVLERVKSGKGFNYRIKSEV